MIHRNSQKRIYKRNGIYFITNVTYNRFPYFEEPVFSRVLIEVINFNKKIKNFKLFNFVIDKTHSHLIIQPRGYTIISEIIRSIKTNSSREINKILYGQRYEGDVAPRRLHQEKQYPDFKWPACNANHSFGGQAKIIPRPFNLQ